VKAKLIQAIGGGKPDPPELLWRVMAFNAITPQELERAREMKRDQPNRLATVYDDAEQLVRQPSPREFLAAAIDWDEAAHPREGGRFTFKDKDAPEPELSDAGNKASEIERLATEVDFGHVTETWGVTTETGEAAWNDRHNESVGIVGKNVEQAVGAWSWGAGIDAMRDLYTDYRETGSTSPTTAGEYYNSDPDVNEGEDYAAGFAEGAQDFFEMMDANTVDAELYRGQGSGEGVDVESLKVGDVLPDGITSWSRDSEVANVFKELDSDLDSSVTMTSLNGAHGVDIAALGQREFAWQEEVVVGGPLTVVDIEVQRTERKDGRVETNYDITLANNED
jgi:hypothetical protein